MKFKNCIFDWKWPVFYFVKLITVLRRCNSHSSLLLNVVFLNYPLRSLPAVKMNACPTHSHHTMVDNFESRNQTESHTESQEASRIGHKSDDGNFLVSFDACDHWILKRGNRKKCFYFQSIFFCVSITSRVLLLRQLCKRQSFPLCSNVSTYLQLRTWQQRINIKKCMLVRIAKIGMI